MPTSQFEEQRPRLLSLAYRLLGSVHDAEDAVQTAWVRVATAPGAEISNVPAYLTRVVTNVCLDQLRERQRRDRLTQRAEPAATETWAADEEFLRREAVGRALMVLLSRLAPTQRAAYVLHDLFAVPFDEIAGILGVTPAAAKKHASRARARLRPDVAEADIPGAAADREVVEAFLRAAAGGDVLGMVALMAPECVRIADPELLPPGTPSTVSGAWAVAEETRLFAERIRCRVPMRRNGHLVDLIAPGGHPLAAIDVDVRAGLVAHITISAVRGGDVLAAANQLSTKWDL
ncbi:sigma-70 family RNA polymerase sigma factor [Mycobacterium sp. ITM-2016-00317]|uniref:sigma-70 family RNA polymerase sigma factor n=1 Tax=Mycobacterium sp. ITM-2016-00317 TaxID=2099694 RepID=UPI00287F56EE|nr:sigma-70 family RNA polymerase sigma factor [Mycobacterium sp. ITM-2016-00317]WNG86453.1 sigma-70 family RNA polymerase sigma factor [Mycobacterium sp. ITM-2016-00317]